MEGNTFKIKPLSSAHAQIQRDNASVREYMHPALYKFSRQKHYAIPLEDI